MRGEIYTLWGKHVLVFFTIYFCISDACACPRMCVLFACVAMGMFNWLLTIIWWLLASGDLLHDVSLELMGNVSSLCLFVNVCVCADNVCM